MQFFEITEDERKLGDIGRKMMDASYTASSDELFNKLCRIGNELTTVGAPFGKRLTEFTEEEKQFVFDFIDGKIS